LLIPAYLTISVSARVRVLLARHAHDFLTRANLRLQDVSSHLVAAHTTFVTRTLVTKDPRDRFELPEVLSKGGSLDELHVRPA
jgi:hypothetical protein